jgi:hypothetical protein
MCEKCQQLEAKIQHYGMIAAQAFDSLTVERMKEFIRELVVLHSDFDRLRLAVRLAPAGVLDQRGPRCCEASLAAF